MEQRLSLITLGVADLARARHFYEEGLGWIPARLSSAEVTFFQLNGIVLALFPLAALAEDADIKPGQGYGRVALAHNVRERADVDLVLAEAERAGGTILKPGTEAFWGGYSGYFADPEGHLWEVAWNPQFRIAEDGSIELPR